MPKISQYAEVAYPLTLADYLVIARAGVNYKIRTGRYAGQVAAPTVNDDTGDGYQVGDLWMDETNDRMYICLDNSAGAAIWKTYTGVYAGKAAAPTVNDDANDGYQEGDLWVDETNNRVYFCVDNAVGAAIWHLYTKLYPGKAAAPGVGDDANDGYQIGDLWIDETNDAAYICLDTTVGAAVWTEITGGGGGNWGAIGGTITDQTDLVYFVNPPDAFMRNGKISVTVAANNITVAIKTLAGNNPSAGEPVYIRIGDTVRTITAALSVTKNAATNWFNAGGSELATKEIDYFVYLGYNATDGVVIGFARIPYGREYSDFSTTTTNEKYCAISNISHAASGDDYVNIGRFAATLSAGAGYTWSVPTYTNINLIQFPIFETRWLSWQPVYDANYTSVTTSLAQYKIRGIATLDFQIRTSGTSGAGVTQHTATLPFEVAQSALSIVLGAMLWYDGSQGFGGMYTLAASPDAIIFEKYNGAAYANATVILNGGNARYAI